MQKEQPNHRFVDHTGEVELHLEAADLAGLFEEAARALAELMLGEASGALGEAVRVELAAEAPAELLFDWINELVFLSETRKLVFTDVSVDDISDQHLVAQIRGVEPASIRTAVKAATFHHLSVERVQGGVRATVVLDV
jgi:SHS2 domain-containing protein